MESPATGSSVNDEGFGRTTTVAQTTSSLAADADGPPSPARDEGVAAPQSSIGGDAVPIARDSISIMAQTAPTPETRGQSQSQPDSALHMRAPQTEEQTSNELRAMPRGNDEPVANRGNPPQTTGDVTQNRLSQSQPCPPPVRKMNKNTKAHLSIGALNMRGLGSTNFNDPRNKWYHLNQLMKEKNIGVLILGESHLNSERRNQLENLYGDKLKIMFLSLPNNPNAKG
ncbi:hypothetical protein V5O48_019032, partial [Marasmius crinis-equi]